MKIRYTINKLFYVLGVAVMWMFNLPAMAALPTQAPGQLGQVQNTSDPTQWLDLLTDSGVGVAATLITALVTVGVIWHTWGSFVESREKGNWKSFGITASIGSFVIAATVGLAILATQFVA